MVAHSTEKSFSKLILTKRVEIDEQEENNPEFDDTIEYFEPGLECLEEDLTDFSKCTTCELEQIAFCAEPCGHMLCEICIEDDECAFCNTAIESRFAIFK